MMWLWWWWWRYGRCECTRGTGGPGLSSLYPRRWTCCHCSAFGDHAKYRLCVPKYGLIDSDYRKEPTIDIGSLLLGERIFSPELIAARLGNVFHLSIFFLVFLDYIFDVFCLCSACCCDNRALSWLVWCFWREKTECLECVTLGFEYHATWRLFFAWIRWLLHPINPPTHDAEVCFFPRYF